MLSLGLFPLCKKEDFGPGDQSPFRQNILRVFHALGKWLHTERPLGVSNPVVLVGAICSPGGACEDIFDCHSWRGVGVGVRVVVGVGGLPLAPRGGGREAAKHPTVPRTPHNRE